MSETGSPFRIRGVIEGFYGHPWTHDQRLALLDFLGPRGMNRFVYGPKDDPLVRRRWREPYAGEDLARLRELVDRGQTTGMELTWCISPGLDIRYSHRADRAALLAKLRSVVDLGVRHVGLFLDDIPMELQHDDDRAAFQSLEHAHIDLVGMVTDGLPLGTDLVVCPTVYWGTGTEDYLADLGGEIDPRVDLFWTGRAICSATLDLADAETFTHTAKRLPTYWDNYPVNDVAMGYELHVGPYRGRDPFLWRSAAGVIANGMELFEASRIPFATIADYLRDPIFYDPEASWSAAIRDVAGPDAGAFRTFADNVRSSCLATEDAPFVSDGLARARLWADAGDEAGAAHQLHNLARQLLPAADHLLRGPVANPALIEECRPWLVAFELGARTIGRMADLAAEGRLLRDARELIPDQIRLRRARVRVFGDALEMTLSDLTGLMFRPGEVPQLEGDDP